MTDKNSFDLVVVGAGPGGYVCAIRAAQLGLRVACVESSKTLGGTCLNVGCIPSKAMLESSHHYHMANHELNEHGIEFGNLSLNLDKMLKRKNEVVSSITKGVEFLFSKNKVEWVKGRAKLQSSNEVVVVGEDKQNRVLKASNVVIATGSVPTEIPSAVFDHKQILDSTDALALTQVPKHLVVVGGGVIGLELGSVWLRLGAKVTVIEATGRILGGGEATTANELMKILKKQGMKFHLNTMLTSTKVENGQVQLSCKSKSEDIVIEGDKVLVSVGRRACSEGLGLQDVGVKVDQRGKLEVDKHYKTSVDHVYAIGDVIDGPMLAHKAEEEGIAVAEHLAGHVGHVNYDAIPSIVYTWPEQASIGKCEEQCKAEGIKAKVGKFFFKANGRAKAMGSSDGFLKILSDPKSDKLLGVHIVGPLASEMIAEAAIAFEFGASAEDIARSVHAHPTLAEVFKEAALDVEKRAIHS